MRRGFGVQSPDDLAAWMRTDRKWAMELVWCRQTGGPARDIGDYHEATLIALFAGDPQKAGDNFREESKLSPYSAIGGEQIFKPPLKMPTRWDEAIETGDPVVDEWERQIERGEIPDLSHG